MNMMVYAVIAESIVCIGCLVLFIMQKKKMTELAANLLEREKEQKQFESQQRDTMEALKKEQEDFTSQQKLAFEDFCLKLKQQMFIHEAKLLSEHGEWCLEYEGEKKYFSPGKIERVSSAKLEEESSFEYVGDEVICTVTQNGQIKSELIFTRNGAPKSGKIFEDGKLVKEFTYNSLGQVEENK